MTGYRLMARMAATLIVIGIGYGILSGGTAVYFDIPYLLVISVFAILLPVLYIVGVEVILRASNAREVPQSEAPNLFYLVEKASEEMGVEPPTVMVGNFKSPNAFSVGRKENGTIVISESLVELLEPEELASVLAHEISHIRSRDVIPVVIGISLPVLFAYLIYTNQSTNKVIASIQTILTTVLSALAYFLVFPVIRHREFVADSEASDAADGDALASALEKIAQEHRYQPPDEIPILSGLFIYNTPANLREQMVGTHPSIQSRIDKLKHI